MKSCIFSMKANKWSQMTGVFLRVSFESLFLTQSSPSPLSGQSLQLSHTTSTCPHFPVHSCNSLFFSVHPTPLQMKLSGFFLCWLNVHVICDSIDWLVLWCLTPHSTIFQLYHGGIYFRHYKLMWNGLTNYWCLMKTILTNYWCLMKTILTAMSAGYFLFNLCDL